MSVNNLFNHNEIAININECLRNHFDRKKYRSFQEAVWLKVDSNSDEFVQPDVLLLKATDVSVEGEMITRPLLIALQQIYSGITFPEIIGLPIGLYS